MRIWDIIWERIRDGFSDEEWISIISEDERKRQEAEWEEPRPELHIEPPPPPEPPPQDHEESDTSEGGVIIIEM